MKNVVHKYYENLIGRILFMNITKILYEECCSLIIKTMNISLKLFYLNNKTKQNKQDVTSFLQTKLQSVFPVVI